MNTGRRDRLARVRPNPMGRPMRTNDAKRNKVSARPPQLICVDLLKPEKRSFHKQVEDCEAEEPKDGESGGASEPQNAR